MKYIMTLFLWLIAPIVLVANDYGLFSCTPKEWGALITIFLITLSIFCFYATMVDKSEDRF